MKLFSLLWLFILWLILDKSLQQNEITCEPEEIPNAVLVNPKWSYRNREQANYVCKDGYRGNPTRTCGRDGWTGYSQCTEIKCERMDIPNAELVDPKWTYGYTEQANYVCRDGYTGNPTLTCERDGWTGYSHCTEITCEPEEIPNAELVDPRWSYRLREQANYVCKEGYTGNPIRTCGSDGWTGNSQCSEKTCEPEHISNAELVDPKLGYAYNEQANYVCRDGYRGNPTRICKRLRWSGSSQCTEITCEPEGIPNAELVDSKRRYKYREQAKYDCKDGYTGNPTRTCGSDGWTGNSQCSEKACEPEHISNAELVDPKLGYAYNEQANYVCRDGYRGNPTRICERWGWSGSSQCTEITCEPEGIPNAVLVRPKWRYKYREQAKYDCEEGYTGNPTRTCGSDGWTGNSQCSEKTCEPEHISNAELVDPKLGYAYNEQANYVCRDGYRGNPTRICKRFGWTGSSQCTEITCEPEEIPNAELVDPKRRYKYREQAKYDCKEGYTGNPTRTCERDGWTGNSQCSEPLGCSSPPHLANGDIRNTMKSQYSHNERVEYVCQMYYVMEGEPHRTCINGEWTSQQRCLKPCTVNDDDLRERNITLKSGDIKYYTHDDMIEFRCARGIPVGAVAMHQRCNSGVILLPTCQ